MSVRENSNRYCDRVTNLETTPSLPTSRWRSAWYRSRWFVPAAVVTVLLRLRFFFVPLFLDEGGQYAVARAWHRGALLYTDIWLDRPVGMLLVYRLIYALRLDVVFGVRLLALLFCLIGSAACGRIAARLTNNSAAPWAALFVALLLSVPRLDGYMANGELMSGALGVLCLAVLLRGCWNRDRPHFGWLILGGFLGGCALSIKQSGFDALGAGLLILLYVCLTAGWSRRDRLAAVPAALAGLGASIGLMLIHAAIVGFAPWWNAVVGFRSTELSIFSSGRLSGLKAAARRAFPALILLAIVLVVLLVLEVRRRRFKLVLIAVAWYALGTVAFLAGGLFSVHYFIILLFPSGTLLAAMMVNYPQRRERVAIAVVALLLPLLLSIRGSVSPAAELATNRTTHVFEHVASWYRQNAAPGDNLYAQCDQQSVYGLIPSDPAVRFLWHLHIDPVPERRAELAALLLGPNAPVFIAEFDLPEKCDPSGVLEQVLSTRYQVVATVDDVPIYKLKPGA